MHDALDRLAERIELGAPRNERLRLEFGYACTLRVKHLFEEPAVADGLLALGQYLSGSFSREQLQRIAAEAALLASRHQGSRSIDGCGHAAVSASYAVAHALAGKALEAAQYAAYAAVYAQRGYAAVAERESFATEFAWQLQCLAGLAGLKIDGETGI